MTEIDHRHPKGWDPPEYDYVPEYACEVCGAEITVCDSNRYWGLCEECYTRSKEFEDSLTLENAMNYNMTKVEIPDFLAFVYDEEQIRDILLAHFAELDNQKELIKDYALENVLEWAERVNNG